MNWIAPLGLLGLLGIAVLILIYILKPNYQQKIVSSTHVWKLSLKYRKKRLPTSRFRNLLVFLCQVLVITASALILTQPYIAAAENPNRPEKVIIIDASASMQAIVNGGEGETRFERAVNEAKLLGSQTIEQQGQVTVILAGKTAETVVSRVTSLGAFNEALSNLVTPYGTACTFGRADIDGSMALAEDILAENPEAEVVFYTAVEYRSTGRVKVVYVTDLVNRENSEWNAAILDVTAEVFENYYIFHVEVASYNMDFMNLNVYFKATGVNYDKETKETVEQAECIGNVSFIVEFDQKIYSYETVQIWLEVSDSFAYDNSFYLYGGTADTIRVQYCSTFPPGHSRQGQPAHNTFVRSALDGLRDLMREQWNIMITETILEGEGNFEPDGSDYYIFEHWMPNVLPLDGAVLLIDPNLMPNNLYLELGELKAPPPGADNYTLSAGQPHQVMNEIKPEDITVYQYRSISERSATAAGFASLMLVGGEDGGSDLDRDSVFLVKNEAREKIAVLSVNLNYSNLPLLLEWPVLMSNLYDYFIPSTLQNVVYDIDDIVSVVGRGPELDVIDPMGVSVKYDVFPAVFPALMQGSYTVMQELLSGNIVTNNFLVKIAAIESNFSRVETELRNPFYPEIPPKLDMDLIVYFAAALVALLFLEWLLLLREQA